MSKRMPETTNRLSYFWQELKRRKVVRVITVYAAAAFVILELVSIIESKEAIPEKPSRLMAWKIATFLSVIIILALIIIQIMGRNARSKDFFDQEKSIAVLPFENMSDDSEFDHLGDAMTDEIIMQLYKIQEFEVRSRTSIMQYKDTEKGSPEIGEELNVNYLLEGSAQRYEDRVRIRIQLIHAPTDDHIWGEVFNGALWGNTNTWSRKS